MSERHTLTVQTRARLDQTLVKTWPILNRDSVRQMLHKGDITLNDTAARKAGQYVNPGDTLVVNLPDIAEQTANTPPLFSTLSIVYEDERLLVAEKPAGMGMKAQSNALSGSLVEHLSAHCPDIVHVGGANRAGIVLRVEPEVSGLILAAKDEEAYRFLQREAKHQRLIRIYSALVEGKLKGTHNIDQPVGNVKRARNRLNVAREGRTALTQCRGQRFYKDDQRNYTLVEVQPETSRRHQIRVHLAWYGFPIVGDRTYGSRHQPLLSDRLFLHLSNLSFIHPSTEQHITFESQLPAELYGILRYLARPKS